MVPHGATAQSGARPISRHPAPGTERGEGPSSRQWTRRLAFGRTAGPLSALWSASLPPRVPTLTLLGSGGSRPRFAERGVDQRGAAVLGTRCGSGGRRRGSSCRPRAVVPHPRAHLRGGSAASRKPSRPDAIITPPNQSTIHRFFRLELHLPQGRYFALTRVPPAAEVAPSGSGRLEPRSSWWDLPRGAERVVAQHARWSSQLGAQVQWGATDSDLFFNDIEVPSQRLQAARKRALRPVRARACAERKETSAAKAARIKRPYGVRLDMHSGRRTRLGCTVYHVSSDGRWALTPDLRRMSRTQLGYGVHVPEGQVPRNSGAPRDDGLWVSDTRTGECRMLVSLAEVAAHARDASLGGARALDPALPTYAFHAKWNAQMNRVLFVARQAARGIPRVGQAHVHAPGQLLGAILQNQPRDRARHRVPPLGRRPRRGRGHRRRAPPDGRPCSAIYTSCRGARTRAWWAARIRTGWPTGTRCR